MPVSGKWRGRGNEIRWAEELGTMSVSCGSSSVHAYIDNIILATVLTGLRFPVWLPFYWFLYDRPSAFALYQTAWAFFSNSLRSFFLVSSSSFVLMQQTTTVLVDPLACERLHHLYDLGLYVISCRLLHQNASLGSILSTFTNTAQSLFQLITDNWYFSFSIGIELGGRVGVWVPSSYPKFNR